MSLDVMLTLPEITEGGTIHYRDKADGQIKALSYAEWDAAFPGMSLVTVNQSRTVYDANITHNLNKMASEAGIYEALWRPEEINITKARQLIEPLTKGLALLKGDRKHYETFNSPNGWGMYEHFVPFVERYLEACKEYPDANVSVSR